MAEISVSTVIGMLVLIEGTQLIIIRGMVTDKDLESRLETHIKRYHKSD